MDDAAQYRGELLRSMTLDSIEIERGGGGRTVVAYATPFEATNEVTDQHGHYYETVRATAFDRTIAEALGQVQVFYNHARNLDGSPSSAFSIPIGVPLEVKPDGRGLLTRTRYLRTPLADDVLDAIREGAVRAYSYTGASLRPQVIGRHEGLPLVAHTEIRLREYGPTPIPMVSNGGAAILAVRSAAVLEQVAAVDWSRASAVDLADLGAIMERISTGEGAPPPEGHPPPPAAEMTNPPPAGAAAVDDGTAPDQAANLARLRAQQRRRRG